MADRKEWKEQLLSKLLDQYEKSVTYAGENKVKQVFSVKPSDIFRGYNKDFLPPEQLFQEKEFERLIRQMESKGLIHVVPPNTGILRQICAVPERWEDYYACLNRTEKNILKEIALGKTTKEIRKRDNRGRSYLESGAIFKRKSGKAENYAGAGNVRGSSA